MTTATTTPEKLKINTPAERELSVERIFNAPPETVWRAFTDPNLVAQWWGRGNKLVVEKMEVVRGGHWRFVEHGPDGVHGFEGRYREVTPITKLVQTFEWDGMPGHVSVDTMTLEPLPQGRTKVLSHSLFVTAEDCNGMINSGMEQGLADSYAALDRLLERLKLS